jgi:hypothetical protein
MVVLLDAARWLVATAHHLTVAGLDACLDADLLVHSHCSRSGATAVDLTVASLDARFDADVLVHGVLLQSG